jgi:6-phosphogluconate dehydrogenase
MTAAETAEVFESWNEGPLESFLIDLTARVCRVRDPDTGNALVDMVEDRAGQKGTGRWTAQVALDLGVPIPTIAAAIDARVLSSMKPERVAASATLAGPEAAAASATLDRRQVVDDLAAALYASRICAYAQGMALIRQGSTRYDWHVNLAEIGRIWKAGCIIRARLLDPVRHAFAADAELPNLLRDPAIAAAVRAADGAWRRSVGRAASAGIPLLAHASALGYYDSYRTRRLPQNLTQAQRDAFGAHTYVRVDRPGSVHSEWS